MQNKNNSKKIIFLGDITGRQGRNAVKSYVQLLRNEESTTNTFPTFIIANIENASHGFGLTKKNYEDLSDSGIDCMTSGNHIWDKKDIYEYIDSAQNLIRPINYPKGTPGVGSQIFEFCGEKIGIINVLGRVFMPMVESPWQMVVDEIMHLQDGGITSIFIDFHAEATAEKICFAKYLAQEFNNEGDALIKGFFGTHTHVQTADNCIINNKTGYITDAGFCGAENGVIGMDYATSLNRFLTCLPERYEIADSKSSQINAVIVDVNVLTGNAVDIKRFICSRNEIEEVKSQ